MPSPDFPRGWTLAVKTNAAQATITVPAAPGIVHVLDSFFAKVVNANAALTSADVTVNGNVIATLFAGGAVAPTDGVDSDSDTVEMASVNGGSLVVAVPFTAGPGPAATVTLLRISGHDN